MLAAKRGVAHAAGAFRRLAALKLMLLNLLYRLDAPDRYCRVIESFESEHPSGPLLDAPMVLLNPNC